MRSILRAAVPGELAPTRIVCLPGAFDRAENFLDAGFDARVQARNLALDLVFVDVELDHLGDRRVIDGLQRDVVAPARALGCRSIWLAGISLGGFMALDYAIEHPRQADGLCLLAPYLGNRLLIREIAASGGLSGWDPGPLAEADEERRIWRFLKGWRADAPALYLGFGRTDRFAPAHRLLADALPADAVRVLPGGHDWTVWSQLWEQFLDSRFCR